MNRIETALAALKEQNKKALITYVTAGDPDLETTEELVIGMFDNGADIVEIGVPFSDPIAEGIAIQNASRRSLNNGTTLVKIFGMIKSLRTKTDKPLVLMMYLNTIFGFGTERFFKLCDEMGVDGVLVPDMPYEERDEILPYAEKYGVMNISTVAPASDERIRMISESAKGFLYCISSKCSEKDFAVIKEHSDVPCITGVTSEEQARELSAHCDGVIAGSAIVEIIEREKKNSPEKVMEFIRTLKKAI